MSGKARKPRRMASGSPALDAARRFSKAVDELEAATRELDRHVRGGLPHEVHQLVQAAAELRDGIWQGIGRSAA